MRAAALALLAARAALGPGPAGAGPTDIARVDDDIDAPRARFGRTRADRRVLSWPGLEVAVSRAARVAAD